MTLVKISTLTLLIAGNILARIPEHAAQVDIPHLAQSATTIFRGMVSNIIPGERDVLGNNEGAIARFAVDRWYRGERPAIVNVRFSYKPHGAINGHNCIDFQPGSYWIVFANDNGGPLQLADDCEGALPVSSRLAGEIADSSDWFSRMAADFAAGLQDTRLDLRIASIQRLGNVRSRQALPFLQPLLDSKDGEEHEWAVYSALRAGDIRVLPAVKNLLKKYPDQRLPEYFMPREIMEIKDQAAIPDLLAILPGEGQGRLAAIVALSRIKDRRLLPSIAPYLADSNRQVRYEAMAAIRMLPGSSACDISPSAPEEEIDAKERECLAWWQQTGANMVH